MNMRPVVFETWQSLQEFAGREIATSDWLRITQERIGQFADATEDHQWIHLDSERAARESPYGKTIAHGFLTLSLMPYLVRQTIQIRTGVLLTVNYGLNRVRFPAPVREGSEIRARISLQSLRELPDSAEAVFSVSMEVQGETKPCCVVEWVLRYYR
jgi:acyl dehydratase